MMDKQTEEEEGVVGVWSRCVLCAGVEGEVIQCTVRAVYVQRRARSAA